MVLLCCRCSSSKPRLAASKCGVCGGHVCRTHRVRLSDKKAAICTGCLAEKREVGEQLKTLEMPTEKKAVISLAS